MKTRTTKVLCTLSLLLLFSTVLLGFLRTQLWDYDFWWHMATGRYIVETGHLPDTDPFSYPAELSENKNLFPRWQSVVLKQYWLAQVIFYLVYEFFGDAGMIVLRSSLLFLVILSVYWGLRSRNVSFYLTFLFVFFASYTTQSFTGERPVLFTLLFSVFSFLLLDDFKKNRTKRILLLVPLMALWGNMHGGFIIGDAIIAAFIIGETLDRKLKRTTYTRQDLSLFYIATVSSIAASALNPNGFNPLLVSLAPEFRIFTKGIQEYQSVFFLYSYGARSLDIGYLVLLAVCPIVLLFRARKMDLSRTLLLCGLMIMSVTALRFMIFFVILGVLLIGKEADSLLDSLLEKGTTEKWRQVLPQVFAVIMLLSSVAYFFGMFHYERLKFAKNTRFTVPERAVNFIEQNRIPGNVFNDFGFGGYFVWRLYPWKKNFIDTRSLNHTTCAEYGWISDAKESLTGKKLAEGKDPLWKRLLDHYHVNFILFDTIGIDGVVPPLLLTLLENDAWTPIYSDVIGAIFIRNTEENRELIKKFTVPKETVYDMVIVRATQWAITERNPLYLVSLGDIFFKMGRIKDGVTAYEYAIKRFPRTNALKFRLERVKSEFEAREKSKNDQ